MTSYLEDHETWDLIQSPTTMSPTPENIITPQSIEQPSVNSTESKTEGNITAKLAEPASIENKDGTPQLKRNETMDSVYTDNFGFNQRGASRSFVFQDDFAPTARLPRSIRRVPPPPRHYNYSPSPPRRRASQAPVTPILYSSTQLLEKLNYDGIADIPFPGRSSIYLTTYPFLEKDVQAWSWLFKMGVEDRFLHKRDATNDVMDDEFDSEEEWYTDSRGRRNRPIRIHHGRRDRSPDFIPDTADIPSVYLSRALDIQVIPESVERDFTFLIVVRNRGRGGGGSAKLLTAGSRKATGIIMYYEALIGNSVVFVGAVKGGLRRGKKASKFKRVENVDEAAKVAEAGLLGVIC